MLASVPLHRGTLLATRSCEYIGEVVEMEEALARELRYAEEARTCTLMVLESNGKQVAQVNLQFAMLYLRNEGCCICSAIKHSYWG